LKEGRHIVYVRDFVNAVSRFQEKVDRIISANKEIAEAINNIRDCDYSEKSFAKIIAKIQKHIDDLNLEGFTNLESWVENLESRIETILINRLTNAIQVRKSCLRYFILYFNCLFLVITLFSNYSSFHCLQDILTCLMMSI